MHSGSVPDREDRDIFRLSSQMDDETLNTIADRLEFRAADQGYAELSQAYFGDLPVHEAQQILAIGCGTGVEVRSLLRNLPTEVEVVGVDQSRKLIEVARERTSEEGLAERVNYRVGDAHQLEFEEATFDIVLLHTLVSHVDDPLQVLKEAARVTRLGGTVAIFDGDYASITFAYPDSNIAKEIEETLLQLLIANPRVMRDMPLLLREADLELVKATGSLYPNIGTGAFWANVPAAYGGVLRRSGLVSESVVDAWITYQEQAVKENTFFAASNYYTYIARRR